MPRARKLTPLPRADDSAHGTAPQIKKNQKAPRPQPSLPLAESKSKTPGSSSLLDSWGQEEKTDPCKQIPKAEPPPISALELLAVNQVLDKNKSSRHLDNETISAILRFYKRVSERFAHVKTRLAATGSDIDAETLEFDDESIELSDESIGLEKKMRSIESYICRKLEDYLWSIANPMVFQVAHIGIVVPAEDLFQVGMMRLLNVMGWFDPDKGTDFPLYAKRPLKTAMWRHIAAAESFIKADNQILILAAKFYRFIAEYQEENGQPPTPEQIAIHFGKSILVTSRVLGIPFRIFLRQLEEDDADADPMQSIEDAGSPTQTEMVQEREQNAIVGRFLHSLTEYELRLIRMRYLDDETQSIREIAPQFGFSPTKILKDEKRVLKKLAEAAEVLEVDAEDLF